ncbi:MAG: hypothetical protein LBN39_07435 [Planctomycetaceae bacterium]|jgi:hypothetical protein|nr:hypothetical protein [Planctomycetaceae bacterium]
MYRLIFLLSCSVLIGCGQRTVPLKGTVTYADDGSPVPFGIVHFDSASSRSKATIKEDGTFVVGTMKDTDGIFPGTYDVSIVGAEKPGTGKSDDPMVPPPAIPLIDPKYENATTSGLTLSVDGKTKNYDIKVERPKK